MNCYGCKSVANGDKLSLVFDCVCEEGETPEQALVRCEAHFFDLLSKGIVGVPAPMSLDDASDALREQLERRKSLSNKMSSIGLNDIVDPELFAIELKQMLPIIEKEYFIPPNTLTLGGFQRLSEHYWLEVQKREKRERQALRAKSRSVRGRAPLKRG